VHPDPEQTPILADMISQLGEARVAAERGARELQARLWDLEALHEADRGGDCPTCGTPAPCLTMLLLRREVSLDQAFEAVRDQRSIDLMPLDNGRPTPPVPSLAELLAAPDAGVDRFFDALLGDREGRKAS
jgi:hypothetical protein